MTVRHHGRLGVCGASAIVAVCFGLLAAEVWAQAPAAGRRVGGLLPTREKPTIGGGQTRDEMLRKFDLDSDGRIDEGEAEAVRTRTRRDKFESLQDSGLDPLTGRPRRAGAEGTSAAVPPIGHDEITFPPSKSEAPRPKPDGGAERKPAADPAPTPPQGRVPVITGGVRAGAPAVRPGYGAMGPKQELNAGRPREPQLTPGQARVGGAMRPADRSSQQPAAPRAAAPRPSLLPRGSSRPTAEDFGR